MKIFILDKDYYNVLGYLVTNPSPELLLKVEEISGLNNETPKEEKSDFLDHLGSLDNVEVFGGDEITSIKGIDQFYLVGNYLGW